MTFRVGGPLAMPANRKQLGIIGTLAATLALSTAIPALAQDAGSVTALEGIVVTGEKIDRDYLDTFTSVGVATNEDIQNYHLDDLQDTFNQMANVRYFSSDRGNGGFQIRGVNADGVAAATNSQPTISVIIDGATQSVEGLKRGARGVWDVKQVEVLRGPQSNLYGRAALAGAVVVETNDPTFTPEMEVKGSLANEERRDGAFMFSGPIVDNQVAFRVSGEFRNAEKDITFVNPIDAELAEDTYRNIRGKLLIQPEAISGLSALFTVSHSFDQPAANAVTGPNFFDRVFDSSGVAATETRATDVNNYVSNISYGLAEGYTLRSVTAYIDTDVKIDSAPGSTTFFRDDTRDGEDFTQDLRLEIGENSNTGLSGVIGVSYGDFKNDTQTNLAQDLLGIGVPLPIQVGTFGNETETQAIYADLRYKIFGNWSLIGGLRYQHDVVSNSGDVGLFEGVLGFPVPVQYDAEATFNVLLPKYGLAYEIDDTQTIAATATRGYRQGFSELDLDIDLAGPSAGFSFNEVKPEYVWSYELAYRKTTLDKSLTYGVNLFYNKYSNQQISVADADSLIYDTTFNVGSSHSYGAELEGRYNFGNGLTVFGAVGLLKTEFDDFNRPEACFDGSCNGNVFPEAPQLTFSFGGTYKHASGFFTSASASYTGDYYTRGDVNNLSQLEIESHFLVNAKAGYEYQGVTIAVFADNLLDEEYLTGFSTQGASSSAFVPSEASIGDGRIVGVEVRAKF
jgi:iron complex outermembrane recepter protein